MYSATTGTALKKMCKIFLHLVLVRYELKMYGPKIWSAESGIREMGTC